MPGALKKIANKEDVEVIDLFHYIGGGNAERERQWCEDPSNDGFHYGAEEISECVYTYMVEKLDFEKIKNEHVVVNKD